MTLPQVLAIWRRYGISDENCFRVWGDRPALMGYTEADIERIGEQTREALKHEPRKRSRARAVA